LPVVVVSGGSAWRQGSGGFVLGGGRMPMAEWGRVVPAQRTHWAVATTGGVDAFPRSLAKG